VFLADGSLGLLDILARTLLGFGLNCITSERSFISYPIVTQATGAKLITTPLRNDTYDLDAIAAAIDENTRVVVLANPNNPTGTMFDADATDRFLSLVPDHVLVVLDEAYFDFATHFASESGITYSRSMDYVRTERKNVVVLRTFSKAHGLAGIRLGYGCGDPELFQYFGRVRNSFSVSVIAQAAGLAAIRDEGHIRRTVENNAEGAKWLFPQFAKRMQGEGVIVRSLVPWGIANGIRVTIGTLEQNELFIRALRNVCQAVNR